MAGYRKFDPAIFLENEKKKQAAAKPAKASKEPEPHREQSPRIFRGSSGHVHAPFVRNVAIDFSEGAGKPDKSGFSLVGAVGIEPTTSPV